MHREGAERDMTEQQIEWLQAKTEMIQEMKQLGHQEALGELIARQLGSPAAIRRMTAYLRNVKPRNPELVVDEMLAICSEIEAWKKKKESEAANAAYNELLRYGLGGEED